MICSWKLRLFCLLSGRGQSSERFPSLERCITGFLRLSPRLSGFAGPHIPCVSESWLSLCLGYSFFIDLCSVCIKVDVLRGSSPTESKQAPSAVSDVSSLLQIQPFRNHRTCLRWAPLNCNGTSCWIKHDVNFPFRESGCIRKQATSFPQLFLLGWSCGSNSAARGAGGNHFRSARHIPPHSGRKVLISDGSSCFVLWSVVSGILSWVPHPPGEPTNERKKARREEALCLLISCNSWSLLASTCLTQTQAAQLLHLYKGFLVFFECVET